MHKVKITSLKTWTENLISFKINRPDDYNFIAGQFSRLGLLKQQNQDYQEDNIIWRPYSIVSPEYAEELEYYSIVIPDGEFTQTLINMAVGQEILLDDKSYGLLTTDKLSGGKDLWLIATGTGLAPFISILYNLEIWEQYQNIILVHSAKFTDELNYQNTINDFYSDPHYQDLVKDKLKYIKIVTREKSGADLYGRIPHLISNGFLETFAQVKFTPLDSRVMICGNPNMVKEVRSLLIKQKQFTVSSKNSLGNIVTENGY